MVVAHTYIDIVPGGVVPHLQQCVFPFCMPVSLLASAYVHGPPATQLLRDIDLHFAAFGVIKIVIVEPVRMIVIRIVIPIFRITVIPIHMLVGGVREGVITGGRVAIPQQLEIGS
ncbi:hypothetical protein D3C78_585560 [compost metagenome]